MSRGWQTLIVMSLILINNTFNTTTNGRHMGGNANDVDNINVYNTIITTMIELYLDVNANNTTNNAIITNNTNITAAIKIISVLLMDTIFLTVLTISLFNLCISIVCLGSQQTSSKLLLANLSVSSQHRRSVTLKMTPHDLDIKLYKFCMMEFQVGCGFKNPSPRKLSIPTSP